MARLEFRGQATKPPNSTVPLLPWVWGFRSLSPKLLALVCGAWAQQAPDQQFQQAGVCARCHVVSVVEWGSSGHLKAGTNCVSCHGASEGHVIDERNNVKPDRMPTGADVSNLCWQCHPTRGRKTKMKVGCQDCHHVHGLVNPNKPVKAVDPKLEELAARWQRYDKLIEEGDRAVSAGRLGEARSAFRNALGEKPGDARARDRVLYCERQLNPRMPGFEAPSKEFGERTGLPREVRVAGLGTAMVLVEGGAVELGSERYPAARPPHSVRVAPFYLGKFELTQAEWKSLMGSNPSAHQGDQLPVEQISWEDCQAFLAKLNDKVPGGGFRLPTEAEWELAAASAEPAGAAFGLESSRPTGQGQPNALGLHDMLGNVWEWCSSLQAPYPYDARDGREAPAATGMRVLRGGSYADPPGWFDRTARFGERPGRKLPFNGLRLARSIPPAGQEAP